MPRERGRPWDDTAQKSEAAQKLADRARALHALSCLMQLVVTARAQNGRRAGEPRGFAGASAQKEAGRQQWVRPSVKEIGERYEATEK